MNIIANKQLELTTSICIEIEAYITKASFKTLTSHKYASPHNCQNISELDCFVKNMTQAVCCIFTVILLQFCIAYRLTYLPCFPDEIHILLSTCRLLARELTIYCAYLTQLRWSASQLWSADRLVTLLAV